MARSVATCTSSEQYIGVLSEPLYNGIWCIPSLPLKSMPNPSPSTSMPTSGTIMTSLKGKPKLSQCRDPKAARCRLTCCLPTRLAQQGHVNFLDISLKAGSELARKGWPFYMFGEVDMNHPQVNCGHMIIILIIAPHSWFQKAYTLPRAPSHPLLPFSKSPLHHLWSKITWIIILPH